jgi:hypothetical protein
MAKRRSSLKGRGSEILFGEPQPVELEPLASQPDAESKPPEQESPGPEEEKEPSPLLDDPELEKALYEEARSGEAIPEGEIDLEAFESEPPPSPEMEMAFLEEAIAAEEPPDPMTEVPVPTMEVTMDEQEVTEDVAIHEPPPPETSDLAGDVLPPKTSSTFFEMEDLESIGVADVQASEEEVEPFELPQQDLTEEEKQALLARLGDIRIQELDEQISRTYDQVLSRVGENEDLTTGCHNQLLKARDIVLRRDAARIPQAEYYVEQVRARVKRATESESGAKKYAWWIAGWGLFWFAAYLSVLILLNYSWFHNIITPSASGNLLVHMEIFLPAMVWGGIGGVAAVFYSLFKHVGRRDFDTQYNLSYVGKPFLGIILGATVYMIVRLMIMTLGILPAGLAEEAEQQALETPTVAPWIIYLTAWACGFKENRIFDLVDRVMKRIFSGEEAAQPASSAEATEPTG